MIEPLAPLSRRPRISVNRPSGPWPRRRENTTMRRPAKVACMTCCRRAWRRRDVDRPSRDGLGLEAATDVGQRLDLDDVLPEQRGHVGGVGADAHRRLAGLSSLPPRGGTTRGDGEAATLASPRRGADLSIISYAVFSSRIDRKPIAAQPMRSASLPAGGDEPGRSLLVESELRC